MKKYLLLILLFLGSKTFAQTVQNGGFETWSNLIFFYEPQGYVSSNYASVLLGTGGLPRANVTRSSSKHTGTYAAKLESYAQNTGDTLGVPGLLITGALDIANVTIKPGIPVSGGRPTELRGFYKYAEGNMPDSGIITVLVSKYNPLAGGLNIIGIGGAVFNNAATYTEFSAPITYLTEETPDTVIIIMGTTTSIGLDSASLASAPVGSILYVDDLTFFGNAPNSVGSIDKLIEASLYPNPSADLVNVDYTQTTASDVTIQLLSIDGRVVYSDRVYKNTGKQSISINVADVKAGMYQLVITTADGSIRKGLAVVK
jgi:hypothetical protein